MTEDLRFSWNFLPLSQNDLNNSGFPLGLVYEPFINDYPTTSDFSSSSIPQNVSIENSTSTFKVSQQINGDFPKRDVFIFVVDICLTEEQHNSLKTLILQTSAAIPSDALIGFITFGSFVTVHELNDEIIPRSTVLNGAKAYTPSQMTSFMGINPTETKNFIKEYSAAESAINTLVDKLETDIITPERKFRADRCTGTAISDAISIAEACCPGCNVQIIVLTGGPATKGPGQIASLDKKENVRQFIDVQKGKDKESQEARKFYKELSKDANMHNITVNYFTVTYEDSGFFEIAPLVTSTGGIHIAANAWSDQNVADTLINLFSKVNPESASEVSVKVETTPSLKVTEYLGVGEEINNGANGVREWRIPTMRKHTAIAFALEYNGVQQEGSFGAVRVITTYRNNATKEMFIRTTTKVVKFTSDISEQSRGFDQEAAVVLLGRQMMSKANFNNTRSIIDTIDLSIVNFCKKFAVGANFAENSMGIPQMIFYLRRLKCFTLKNASPDESQLAVATFMALDPNDMSLLLVPTLTEYNVEKGAIPLALSANSITNNFCLVLLNSFNRIMVCSIGMLSCAHEWEIRDKEDPGTEEVRPEVKNTIDAAIREAKEIYATRFPSPELYICSQSSSKGRYLNTAICPAPEDYFNKKSKTSLNTEDPEFEAFMNRLREVLSH